MYAWRARRRARRAHRRCAQRDRAPCTPGARSAAAARGATAARRTTPALARGSALGANLRTRALVHGFPLAVAALNRAGLGPLQRRDLLGRAAPGRPARDGRGRRAPRARRRVRRLRPHPPRRAAARRRRERVDRRADGDGAARSGARLVNAGCWTYDSIFLTRDARREPLLAGHVRAVEDAGPPELRRLLLDRTHDELRRRGPALPSGARPGVKQVARHSHALAELQLEHAGRVALVLDQRIRARVRDAQLAPPAPCRR